MKLFKHFILAATLACTLGASAQDGVQTISPYSVDFETTVSTSGDFAVAKGWGRTGTSSSVFSYRTKQGVDGSTAFYCGYQSASSPNYLVTTRLTGTATVQEKNNTTAGYVKFFKVSKNDAGEYVVGDEITPTVSGAPSTTAYTTYSVSGLNNEMIAILGHYALLDNFTATSAEVDLYKSLKVLSCKVTSSATPDCDKDGNFTVAMTGKIYNDGDITLNPGEDNFSYSIGKYTSSSLPHELLYTQPFTQAIAAGDTADVEIAVTLNVADYPNRSRYDLVENFKSTSAYGAWIEPIKYEPKLLLRDNDGYNMGNDENYAKKFGTFGMITTDSEKKFTVENTGAAPMTANITVPAGFTVSESAVSVAAHDKKDLTLKALSATPGIYTGNLSVEVVGYSTVTVPLSATVLDPAKFYENFEGSPEVTTLPQGWHDFGNADKNWVKTSYTNGANNFLKNTSSSDPQIVSTPKLKVEEGELLTFDAARNSTSGSSTINVYYSTDRKYWQSALLSSSIDLSGTNAGTSSSAKQTWSTFVVSGIPAGEYYIGFESGYASIDNVYGFTRVDVAHDVVEMSTDISLDASVNSNYTASVKVRNLNTNTESADAYTATLYFGGEAVATAETVEMTSTASAEFAFTFTPHATGDFPMYMKLAWTDGYEVVTDTVEVTVAAETSVKNLTVGEFYATNSSSPLFLNYKNSVSETLYTAKMLADAGVKVGDKISSITYQGYNSSADLTTELKAFIMNCNDTVYGDGDFTPDAEMTKVFDGEYTFRKEGSSSQLVDMLVINFSEPFVYTGGAIRVKLQSEASTYKNVYFAVANNSSDYFNGNYYCRGNKSDTQKVADLSATTNAAIWNFPVTNFGVNVDPVLFKGKVVDTDNNPIEGVSVVLVNELPATDTQDAAQDAEPQLRYTGVTGADGVYEVPVFKADKVYVATFSKDGYVPVTLRVEGFKENLTITLEEKVPTAVTDVTVSKPVNSNVYTIDGRIVRANATSLDGLDRGIYIFQGKKHIVK